MVKILMAGSLPASAKDISARLAKDGHQVSIMGYDPEVFRPSSFKKRVSP